MATGPHSASLLAIKLNKCAHVAEYRSMQTFLHTKLLSDIFVESHGSRYPQDIHRKNVLCTIEVKTKQEDPPFKIESNVTVGDVVNGFGVKFIEFTCVTDPMEDMVVEAAKVATEKAVDGFQLLMARGRGFPPLKNARYLSF